MTLDDIEEKTADFVRAARMAREAGFDAVETHAGHGYLLNQFLSPWTNRRRDEYGGALAARLRFSVEVLRRVRAEVGADYPILVKMNQQDGMKGGLELDEAVEVAKAFAAAGASALVSSCGFTARTPRYMMRGNVPTLDMARAQKGLLYKVGLAMFGWAMVQCYRLRPLFLLEGARCIRDAVDIPVAYVGGVLSLEAMGQLMAEGFALVELGRATIRDPDLVSRLRSGEITRSDCDHCNRCIAAMSLNGVTCVSAERGLLPEA